MERNYIKQHQRSSRIPCLGLSDKGTIRPHSASYYSSRTGQDYRGWFQQGKKKKKKNLEEWWGATVNIWLQCNRYFSGDRKRKCRVCIYSWFVGDKIRSNEELQFNGSRRCVCRAAVCDCRAARQSFAGRNKQKVFDRFFSTFLSRLIHSLSN